VDRTTPAQPAAPTPRVPQSDVARWAPSARELDDLEVLLLGGYSPLRGFLPPEDVASVLARAQLCDGIPWPVKGHADLNRPRTPRMGQTGPTRAACSPSSGWHRASSS
jgi:hypothetical protein